MILAIDAGNSRIKWGCFAAGEWLNEGAIAHGDIDSLRAALGNVTAPRKIIISNVAGVLVQQRLSTALEQFSVPPHWIASEKACAGVTNGYAQPSQLGSDRWAALIGARRESNGPVLVVNAGTALTIDAMNPAGDFLGGLIVPGIRLMMRSLTTGTAHAHAAHGEFAALPTNTLDAIYSGALNAALGAITRMRDALAARTGAEPINIVSGGAAAALIAHLPPPTREVPRLVLQGLVAIAEVMD